MTIVCRDRLGDLYLSFRWGQWTDLICSESPRVQIIVDWDAKGYGWRRETERMGP